MSDWKIADMLDLLGDEVIPFTMVVGGGPSLGTGYIDPPTPDGMIWLKPIDWKPGDEE